MSLTATISEFEAAMAANGVEVKVTRNLSFARLIDTFICAFEGGSNYWVSSWRCEPPDNRDEYFQKAGALRSAYPNELQSTTEGGRYIIGDSYLAPFIGGSWLIRHENPTAEGMTETRVGLCQIIAGLRLMADSMPVRFQNIIDEGEDADDGDALLQLCCFGELVFC